MNVLSMHNLKNKEPKEPSAPREKVEADKITSVQKKNGNRRRRKGRTESMILRVTEEEKERIIRVADALGYTYTDTFLLGIEELEKKIKPADQGG